MAGLFDDFEPATPQVAATATWTPGPWFVCPVFLALRRLLIATEAELLESVNRLARYTPDQVRAALLRDQRAGRASPPAAEGGLWTVTASGLSCVTSGSWSGAATSGP